MLACELLISNESEVNGRVVASITACQMVHEIFNCVANDFKVYMTMDMYRAMHEGELRYVILGKKGMSPMPWWPAPLVLLGSCIAFGHAIGDLYLVLSCHVSRATIVNVIADEWS